MSGTKDPAAVALGRKGGAAGRGPAKNRGREHYQKMQAKSVIASKVAREIATIRATEKSARS